MKKFYFTLILLLFASVAFAQPPATGGNKLGWDQDAPSLTEVRGYTYKYYPDAATTGIALTPITCVGTVSPYQCEAPFPPFTPGNHSLTLVTSNLAGDSPHSLPLAFTFIVTPGAATGLKIK